MNSRKKVVALIWFGLPALIGLLIAMAVGDLSPFLMSLSLPLLGLFAWSIAWAYEDAESRNVPGFWIALLVALVSWPLGLLIWYIFRPEVE